MLPGDSQATGMIVRNFKTPLKVIIKGSCTRILLGGCGSSQAFSQNLKSGRPGGMSPCKFVKALVHFSSFSPSIGRPQDAWTPIWLKACQACQVFDLRTLSYLACVAGVERRRVSTPATQAISYLEHCKWLLTNNLAKMLGGTN